MVVEPASRRLFRPLPVWCAPPRSLTTSRGSGSVRGERPGQRPGTAFGHVTDDSQDGCRYTIKNGRCVATGFQPVGGSDRGSGRCRPGSEGKKRPSGCRVRYCAGSTLRPAVRPAQCRTGLPRGTWPRERRTTAANDGRASFACGRPLVRSGRGGRRPLSRNVAIFCSGHEAGRRRPIGGVATLPIHHPRDPADGATPGRRRRTGRPVP